MRVRNWLLTGVALCAPSPALAQQAQTPPRPETVTAPPSDAAPASEPEDDGASEPEIVVAGQRERGAVPGDVKPELQLNPADIRSYGVSSVSELLTELGPQVRSDRGRGGSGPVVLLNGRRISGFGEIRDLPTEAIERVDILPEEAALRLGYRADQRVVNFVLRRRFRSTTAEVTGGGSTAGDRFTGSAEVTQLRISRDRRANVTLRYDGATPLYESDRDIIPSVTGTPFSIGGTVVPANGATQIDPALSAIAGRPVAAAGVPAGLTARPGLDAFLGPQNGTGTADFRTLAAATRNLSANGTVSRTILGNVTASLNGSFAATASQSSLGLFGATLPVPAGSAFSPFTGGVGVSRYLLEAGARQRRVEGNTGHLGAALNGDWGDWRWSFTANADRAFSRTLTDASIDTAPLAAAIANGSVNPFNRFDAAVLGDFVRDYARSVTSTFNAETVASGPLATLPGGRIVATLKSGIESIDLDARAVRAGLTTTSDLGRRNASAQASVDLPIARRRTGFLSAIGNLSLNGNAAIDNLSDFGRLVTLGYGANWSPIDAVRINASVTHEDGAPSVAQLGNPVLATPLVRVFDFIRNETVDVTRIDGGNRSLVADDRRVVKIGATIRPLGETDLTLTANYLKTRTLNPIASFPTATAEIEAAFPDRFTRDAAGRLTRIDSRPVNFARSDSEQLRWGVNFSRRVGPTPPPRPAGGFGGFRRRQAETPAVEGTPATTIGAPAATPAAETAAAAPPRGEGRGGGFGQGRGGGFGGFGGGGGGGGFGGGRLNLALYHTWHLEESILIRPGVPVLDLLDGSATGSRGGQPRHEIELQAGVTMNGLGARLSGNWQSGTFVAGGTARTPTDLNFAPFTTLTLRLFANLQPNMSIVREHPWLRGTRVTLTVQNLLDERLRVTDAAGTVPLSYQPDLIDPVGRSVRLSIRKLFFGGARRR